MSRVPLTLTVSLLPPPSPCGLSRRLDRLAASDLIAQVVSDEEHALAVDRKTLVVRQQVQRLEQRLC